MPKGGNNKAKQLDAGAESRVEANASTGSTGDTAQNSSANGQQVLDAISPLKQELFNKIDKKANQTQEELRSAVGTINKRLDDNETRTTDLEVGVSTNADAIAALESEVLNMKKDLITLKARCEDLEARSRRCNIRVTGVKEGREHGKHPSQFVATLLKDALGLDKSPCLDRAHRSLRAMPTQEDQPPRAFTVKCHYYTEKEMLLKRAAESRFGLITTADGDRIRLLPDFTQAVSKQRAAFTEVWNLLRGCVGVRYGLRYPATPRITTADGHESTFKDPRSAKDFVLREIKSA
uniref:Uncharacterized protein n=1 Tax=Knipowitschia caucasica TaxID=637954 RepID=A0AAV2JHZ2_KNICA